jgi:hypothetical protein
MCYTQGRLIGHIGEERTAVVIFIFNIGVWPALSFELNTGFSGLLKMPWSMLVHLCGIFSPRVNRKLCFVTFV